jgi:hypothetical protein
MPPIIFPFLPIYNPFEEEKAPTFAQRILDAGLDPAVPKKRVGCSLARV